MDKLDPKTEHSFMAATSLQKCISYIKNDEANQQNVILAKYTHKLLYEMLAVAELQNQGRV